MRNRRVQAGAVEHIHCLHRPRFDISATCARECARGTLGKLICQPGFARFPLAGGGTLKFMSRVKSMLSADLKTPTRSAHESPPVIRKRPARSEVVKSS